MLDFLKTFFRTAPSSGTTAKERLRLVLLSDHLSLAPDVIDALKRDLLDVISRYVEIDPANADVSFEQRETEVAMLASIPITGVRDRERPRAPSPAIKAPPLAPPAALAVSPTDAPDESVTLAELLAESDMGSSPIRFAAPISLILEGDDALESPALMATEAFDADAQTERSNAIASPAGPSQGETHPGFASPVNPVPRRRRRRKKANAGGPMTQGKLATGSA